MKKTILIILCLSISFSVYAKEQGCTNKEINPKVQLQDNGWLKIVDQYIEEFTPEEYYKGNEQMIKMYKDQVKQGLEREKIRMLNVKIQFLKPCIATTKADEYFKQYSDDEMINIMSLKGEEGKCITLITASYAAIKQGNKEESDEIMQKAIKQCPNILDYMQPRFRCDYRFKVFTTQLSPSEFKKYTSQVFSYFPEAPITDITDNKINRKTEMLPGETMWIKFYISGDTTSWCTWVPK